MTYVGSAESDDHDQELDNALVGPVPVGYNKFVLQTPPPDPSKIPKEDVLGVTVVLITCSYKGQEFIRVGYYVNNEWGDAVERDDVDGPAAAAGRGDEGDKEMEDDGMADDAEDAVAPPARVVPDDLDLSEIRRSILAEKPRVTRFPINWE